VAELDEIFALKALVCAKRSNARDWFDLYTLIQNHGFTLREFQKAFEKSKRLKKLDMAFQRLCSGKPSQSDPGLKVCCRTCHPLRTWLLSSRRPSIIILWPKVQRFLKAIPLLEKLT
jgi:hypothetical protein